MTDCDHKELKCSNCMRDGTIEWFMDHSFAPDGFSPFRLVLSDESKALMSQILVNEIQEQELLNDDQEHGMVWDVFLWEKVIPKEKELLGPEPESLIDEVAPQMTEEDWENFFMGGPPEE